MKLVIFIFGLVLLQALALPMQNGAEIEGLSRGEMKKIAVKAAKAKKAFLDLQDTLLQYDPQVLENLSDAIPTPSKKTMKSGNGSQKNGKQIHKKFIIDFFGKILGGLFGG
uniref:Uncharacterized protein n=1 Tax=Panagrolaimus superbus TaxID=310955 RepID=A0A914Y962_9BILA